MDSEIENRKSKIEKVVVKFYRTQPFCGLPMAWLGRFSRDHERAIYAALEGVAGVPRWLGCVSEAGYALQYVDARPIDRDLTLPAGFFDRLEDLFAAVHTRGVAYVDANKRSNILADLTGQPHLVDFQIALRRRDSWPWPLRSAIGGLVGYLQGRDLFHLYKHKRRLAPAELTPRQERLSRRMGFWHRLHGLLVKPYKAARRRFLRRQYQAGRLVSPTAHLEDHYQPEKETWRKP
jgi:hypothetical protein